MTLHSPEPDKLEQLLAHHLSAQLDPQRGRAAAAFRASLAALNDHRTPDGNPGLTLASSNTPLPTQKPRITRSRQFWLRVAGPSLLAACLAVAVTIHFLPAAAPTTTVVPPTQVAGTNPQPAPGTSTIVFDTPQVNQLNLSRQINGGITFLDDNTPVRIIRQQDIRQTQWVDPHDNATYTGSQSVEKVGYIKVQPY